MSDNTTARLAVEASAAPTDRRRARRRERIFYLSMGAALFVPVFASFAPSLYLREFFHRPPLTPLVYLHGVLFTLWLVVFLVQSILVASHQIKAHRRCGMASLALVLMMVVVGSATALTQAARGRDDEDHAALKGLVIPLTDMVMFSGLFAAGFYYRRLPDVHKRLMLLASIAILPGSTARLPLELVKEGGPIAYLAIADLFLVPCLAYDLFARGRLHPATVIGCLALPASQVLRLLIGRTRTWIEFAAWLTQWVP